VIGIGGGIMAAVGSGLRAWSALAELKLRRLALDEEDKIDRELAELEAEMGKLRRAGRNADADRLLQRAVRRAVLREHVTGLLDAERGPDLSSGATGALGGVSASRTEGPRDSGSTGGAPQVSSGPGAG